MQKPSILVNTFIFFPLLSFFLNGCQQVKEQDHFTITGKLSNLKDSLIYLQYLYKDSVIQDSAKIKNGSFTFHGKVAEPSWAMIYLPEYKGACQLFIENAEMDVHGNADSLENLTMTGSPSENEYVSYTTSRKPITKEIRQASMDYETAKSKNDERTATALEKKIKELDDKNWEAIKKFITANPKSHVSISVLGGWTYSKDYNELFQLYSGLDTSIQHSYAGMRTIKNLNKLKNVSVGSEAMDFTKNDTNGKPVKLSDFRGKWVLVDFWASWCGPCRAENPNVLKNYNAYKEKGFTVFGVSLDDSASKWKKAIAEDKMPWTQVCSFEGWKDPVSQEYAVEGIPSNFLISPQGIILARNLRGEALDNKLQEVIGK